MINISTNRQVKHIINPNYRGLTPGCYSCYCPLLDHGSDDGGCWSVVKPPHATAAALPGTLPRRPPHFSRCPWKNASPCLSPASASPSSCLSMLRYLVARPAFDERVRHRGACMLSSALGECRSQIRGRAMDA